MLIKKSQLQKIIIEEVQNTINEISKRRVRFKKRRQAALLSDPERGKYGLGEAGITVRDIQMALLDIDPDKYLPILSGVKATDDNEKAKSVVSATDGKYGRRTYNAIRAFQKDFPPDDASGADGLVGAFTAAKIIEQAPSSEFAQKLSQKGFVSNMSAAGHKIIQKGREAAAASPAPEDPNVVVSPEDGPQKPPETVDASGAAGIVVDKPQMIQTTSRGVAKGTYKKMAIEAPEDLESLLVQLSKEAQARGDELRNLTGLPEGAPAERINKYLDFMVKTYKKDLESGALEEAQGDSAEMLQKINNLAKAQHKAYSIFDQARKEKAEAIKEKLPDQKPSWVADMVQKKVTDEDAVKQIFARYDYIKEAYSRFTSHMFKGSFGMTPKAYLATRKPETLVPPQAKPRDLSAPTSIPTDPGSTSVQASVLGTKRDGQNIVVTMKDTSGRTVKGVAPIGASGDFGMAKARAEQDARNKLASSVNESKKRIKIKLIESNRQIENTVADLNPETVKRVQALKKRKAAAQKELAGLKAIPPHRGSSMTWTDIKNFVQSGVQPPSRQKTDGKYVEG